MDENYIAQAKTKVIKFNSRASIKLKEQYYTFEYGEEREIQDIDKIDINKEIVALTQHCNNVVDDQLKEIVNAILYNK